jgi:uncharacterized protein YbjQ (UPF0145 family)
LREKESRAQFETARRVGVKMNVKDIASQFNLPASEYNSFVRDSEFCQKKSSANGFAVVDDENIAASVEAFLDANILLKQAIDEERQEREAITNMPITSGYSFEGYRIIRYAGYISGDEVLRAKSTFFSSNQDKAYEDLLRSVRRKAIRELKEAAADLGCNAVIGLDFDYINFERGSSDASLFYLGLTANGTAVQIEAI